MVKYIAVLAFVLSTAVEGFACDACGCSIAGQGIGLMTNLRTNISGVRYYYNPFHASPNEGSTQDHFHVFEAFIRYQVNTRLKLTLTQPYRNNIRQDDGAETLQQNGFSDTRLVGSYALLDKWVGKDSRLYWEMGGGLKFPIGKYDADILDSDLPDNFNVGNGSWGFLFQSSAVYSFNQFGISLNTSAQLNAETDAGYHFGNQLSSSLMLFAEKTFSEKGRLIPFAGLNVEAATKDRHANSRKVHGTGGQGLYANVGLNIGLANWQVGASYAKPLTQNYSDGEVLADGRFSIEMNYFF